MRGLAVGVTRINARKQITRAAFSLDRIASKCWCWVRSDSANPSKTRRLADHRIKFAPKGTCPGRRASDSVKVPVAAPGRESSGGSARRTSTLHHEHKIIWCIPSGERESNTDLASEHPSKYISDNFHKIVQPLILNKSANLSRELVQGSTLQIRHTSAEPSLGCGQFLRLGDEVFVKPKTRRLATGWCANRTVGDVLATAERRHCAELDGLRLCRTRSCHHRAVCLIETAPPIVPMRSSWKSHGAHRAAQESGAQELPGPKVFHTTPWLLSLSGAVLCMCLGFAWGPVSTFNTDRR